MHNNVDLSQIKKCNQIWDEMPEHDKGKQCSKCKEFIHDFRGMSKWEVAVVHAHSEKRICGIYDEEVLAAPFKINKTKRERRNLILASTIGLMSTNVASSIPANQCDYENGSTMIFEGNDGAIMKQSNNMHEMRNVSQVDSLKLVRGTVVDESGASLSGCNIIILGTSEGTITELDGSFVLDLTEAIKGKDSIVLDISYTGYGKLRETVLAKDLKEKDEVYLDLLLKYDLEMEVFNVSPKRSFHQRVWQKIKSMF